MRLRFALAASLLCSASCSQPAPEPESAKHSKPEEPRAQPSDPTGATISVTVTPTKLFVRGKPVARDQLQPQLEALAKRYPDATIAVQADATVPSERMTDVVKTIKTAGFSTVAIATRPVE